MMDIQTVKLTIYGPRVYIQDLPESMLAELKQRLIITDDECHRDPRYKEGYWDGTYNFLMYDKNQEVYFFPFGFLSGVIDYLRSQNVTSKIFNPNDISLTLPTIEDDYLAGIKLRQYQIDAAKEALEKKRCIIALPTGAGKTEIAAAIFKHFQSHNLKCLYLTGRVNVMYQTRERFEKRGLSDIGCYGHKISELDKSIVIAMIQSVYLSIKEGDSELIDYLHNVNAVVYDEVHHSSSNSAYVVLNSTAASFYFGLTATPYDAFRSGATYRNYAQLGMIGPVISSLKTKELVEDGYLLPCHIIMLDIRADMFLSTNVWHVVRKKGLNENERRNEAGVKLAARMFDNGHKVLVAVREIKHGRDLLLRLYKMGYKDVIFSRGNNEVQWCELRTHKPIIRKKTVDPVELAKEFEEKKSAIIIGSVIYEEGVDLPSLDCIVNMCAGRSPISVIQKTGRSLRPHPSLKKAIVFDFVDKFSPVLKAQSNVRRKVYESEGHLAHDANSVSEAIECYNGIM